METPTEEYDVSINGSPHFVGTAFRHDKTRAKAIFDDAVGRRHTGDVVAFLCNGKVIDSKPGARKSSGRGK
jgi:hypothetical protein